jgi:hypothetical protein
MNIRIKNRIYLSLSLVVVLCVINAIITILTLNKIQNSTEHLSKVVEPSLESLIDFRKMMLQSDIYITNSVFFKQRKEDKLLLNKIGLSHCEKIVELHLGKIWVQSTLHEGSTFYFSIPSLKQKTNEPKTQLHIAHR